MGYSQRAALILPSLMPPKTNRPLRSMVFSFFSSFSDGFSDFPLVFLIFWWIFWFSPGFPHFLMDFPIVFRFSPGFSPRLGRLGLGSGLCSFGDFPLQHLVPSPLLRNRWSSKKRLKKMSEKSEWSKKKRGWRWFRGNSSWLYQEQIGKWWFLPQEKGDFTGNGHFMDTIRIPSGKLTELWKIHEMANLAQWFTS